MKKSLLIRIFNIIFIAAAGVACFSFATKPLIDIEISATVKKEKIGELAENLNAEEEESETPTTYPVRIKRLGDGEGSSQFDIKKALSKDRVANSVGDLTITVPVMIPAKKCFDLDNERVINEILEENIQPVVHNIVTTITPKFKNLIKSVTMDFAKDVMKEQVANQIMENFGKDIPIPEEKIDAIVDNVYAKLDKKEGETTTISELSNAILGSKEYVLADPQPTADTFANAKYYVLSGEEYVEATEFAPETQYYVADFGDGVRGILQYVQQDQIAKGETPTEIDFDNINMSEIEDQMVEALDGLPNLTTHNYSLADPQPNEGNFGEKTYFIKNGEEYEKATEFVPATEYYTDTVTISNIDDALLGLMDMFLNNKDEENAEHVSPTVEGENPEPQASRRVTDARAEEASTDRLSEKVESVIYDFLPLDDLLNSDLSLGGYAPKALFGLVMLGMFPWALFILLTLIRTIRPKKCWTKTWIIFTFAFTQLILGVGLTIGLKYAMPFATKLIEGTAAGAAVSDISLKFATSCLIPSIIYLAFIPLTIIYMIIRHKYIKDFKQMKADKKAAKKAEKLNKQAA